MCLEICRHALAEFSMHSSIDFCVCCCTYSSLTISVIYLFYFPVPSHPSASCAESNLYFLFHVFLISSFFLNSSVLLHNLFSSQHSPPLICSLPYVCQGIPIQKALFKKNSKKWGLSTLQAIFLNVCYVYLHGNLVHCEFTY